MVVIEQDAEKVRQRYGKVKAEAKAEMKKVRSSLNLDLNLSLPRSLRPCREAFLSILRGALLLSQTYYSPGQARPAI